MAVPTYDVRLLYPEDTVDQSQASTDGTIGFGDAAIAINLSKSIVSLSVKKWPRKVGQK